MTFHNVLMILGGAKDIQAVNIQDFQQVPSACSSIYMPRDMRGPPLKRTFSSLGLNMQVTTLAICANPEFPHGPSGSS